MGEEWKVVSYVGRLCHAFAVASLQPSFAPSLISPRVIKVLFVVIDRSGREETLVRRQGKVPRS